MKTRRVIGLLFAAGMCVFAGTTSAYIHKKSSALWPIHDSRHEKPTVQQLRSFEQQLMPFFTVKRERNTHGRRLSSGFVRPAQEDFFKIARYWSSLSPEFKTAYLLASEIPQTMNKYVSPRGLFEVYYYTTGFDSVDRTDRYGYNASNWRAVSSSPNGVPDYIDEVAWAFDSAWSMEIDRYGFVRPNPLVDNSHPSSAFKVIVREMDSLYDIGTYGMTLPAGKATGNAIGQQSYIELRNEWRSPLWSGDTALHTDYINHPQWGAWVTAVHEFFHTVQFAMTRADSGHSASFLDYFPQTWLEATGVLMEQTGFADIKDYLQYVGGYFNDPTRDIFSGYADVYTTSLMTLYLYEDAIGSPDVAFIKNMFFNNYANTVGFYDNLIGSSAQCGTTWSQLLGNFHTYSFFSGSRSVPFSFLPDAARMPQWAIVAKTLDAGNAVRLTAPSYGMDRVVYQNEMTGADALTVEFIGDSIASNPTKTNPLWNVHGIVQNAASADSIFDFPISNSGHGVVTIDKWHAYSRVVVIASNARNDGDHGASVVFEPCPISIKRGDSVFAAEKIITPLSAASSIQASVIAYQDLACSLSVVSVPLTAEQSDSARKNRLVPLNGNSLLSFPFSWTQKATVSLVMREDSVSCLSFEYTYQTTPRSFSIYKWNSDSSTWTKVNSGKPLGATYSWRFAPCTPGVYGLFCRSSIPLDSLSENRITAFPNPIHIKSQSVVKFYGTGLMQLIIYDVRGMMVFRRENAAPQPSMSWPVAGGFGGRPYAPGMYYARIDYKDNSAKGLKQKKQKVVVAP
ncbi:MAG TPA: hypothetical protein VF335_02050 [Chitinivibrionales bacterium]